GPRRGPVLERLQQILSEPEDLIGVAVHKASHVSCDERPPGFRKQFLAQARLESTQLRADCWRGERKLLASARQTSRTHDRPEVGKVLIVPPPYYRHHDAAPAKSGSFGCRDDRSPRIRCLALTVRAKRSFAPKNSN